MSPRRLRWMTQALLKRHRKLAALLLGLIIAASFTWRFSNQEDLRKNALNLFSSQKYVEGILGTPQTLNPLFVASDSERDLSKLLFRGLTKTNLAGEVSPDLALSWETSSSGQVYLFHLKPDLKFQNGDPVTADDVAYTYELAKDPATGSLYASTFQDLEINIVSETSILFRLKDPYTPFLSITDLGILPKKIVGNTSPQDLRFSKFSVSPVGNTAFRLKSFNSDEAVLVKGGSEYVFKFYQNYGELLTALKLGEIKSAGFSEPVDLAGWGNLQQFSSPLYRRFTGIFYNLRQGITADRGVRQALSYSLEKGALLELAGGGVEPAYSPIPPVSWAKADNLKRYDYKPDLAKLGLEKSGWVGGPVRQKDGKSADITLSFIDSDPFKKLAEEVAKQWGDVGVRGILNPLSPIDFRTKVSQGKDFQAAIFTQEVGIDPDQYVLWHSTQADLSNITGLKLPRLDKALEDGRQLLDKTERQAKYADFQRFLLDESPVSFLYYPKYTYLVSSKVEGVNLAPLGSPGDRLDDILNWKVRRTIF